MTAVQMSNAERHRNSGKFCTLLYGMHKTKGQRRSRWPIWFDDFGWLRGGFEPPTFGLWAQESSVFQELTRRGWRSKSL